MDLKISLVEYTLDIFCTDLTGVHFLFKALKKHLFRPYKRKVMLLGKGKQAWGDDTRMNAYYRSGDAKIYERGPDKKRKNKAWVLKDADRIRLEFTAARQTLVKNGLHVFSDFMNDPKFYAINKDIYRFKCFKGSKKLPGYGKPYAACDANDHDGCFQLEVNRHRHSVRNIHQYIKDVSRLDFLRSELTNAMVGFDAQWNGLT